MAAGRGGWAWFTTATELALDAVELALGAVELDCATITKGASRHSRTTRQMEQRIKRRSFIKWSSSLSPACETGSDLRIASCRLRLRYALCSQNQAASNSLFRKKQIGACL